MRQKTEAVHSCVHFDVDARKAVEHSRHTTDLARNAYVVHRERKIVAYCLCC